MIVEAVELFHVRLPLVFPFETSFGREDDKDCLLVRVEAGGRAGWGEVSTMPAPLYNEETNATAWHVLADFLIPALLGKDVRPGDLPDRFRAIRRHHMAKAGLEAALWDLQAQEQGTSLARALGGTRDRIEVGVSLGIEPALGELLDRVDRFLPQGYRRVKLKIKPGWDVEVVRAVRRHFGDIGLQVDANSAYTLADAPVFRAMDDEGLLMIEQPLAEDDIVDHAQLQAQLKTPICLDESIVTPDDARKALDLGSCRVINVKQARLGGVTNAVRVHDLCQRRGVPVWCGGMLETGVGRALNLALASLPNFSLPADLSASDRYFEQDIIDPPVSLGPDGTIAVPDGVGLGFRVLEDRIGRVTLRHARFKATRGRPAGSARPGKTAARRRPEPEGGRAPGATRRPGEPGRRPPG